MPTEDAQTQALWSLLSRRRDRREFLRDAARAGLGVAGLALVGCQQQPSPTPAPASAAGKPTGRLVYGITAITNAFDPGTQQTTPGRTPFHAVWDTVTNLNTATGAVEPSLAESWRVVDDKTVEVKLRRGISFHNGRELAAEDVKFTLERLLDPANRLTVGNLVREIDHIEIVDSHTFRAVAKTATPTIALTLSRIHVLPAAEFKAAGSADAFFAKPIGTGAFRLKEFGRESFVELVTAENSWRKPKLAEIRLQALTEDSARIAALRSGQVDLIDGVPPDQIKSLEGGGYKTEWTSLAANYALDLFGQANTPHAKLEVRRAMAHAIDWPTIVKEIYQGYARLSNGLIGGPGAVGWADDPSKYPYDPAKARQLLAQAGFPNGFKAKMMSSRVIMVNAVPTAEAIVNYLREVKVDVELTLLDAATNLQFFLSTYEQGRAPLWIFRHSYDLRMDVAYQLVFYDDKQSIHKYGWNNADFNALLATAQKEMDPKKREPLLLQANRTMLDHAITVTGFQPPYIAVHSQKVSGVKTRADGLMWLDDLAKSA
ncbi:MAG: ABC transporter substrate-binding protein [Chloroflexi bacterium]|nr:ABC transporter substrate-binding protein [Chloroflexota bacterium]